MTKSRLFLISALAASVLGLSAAHAQDSGFVMTPGPDRVAAPVADPVGGHSDFLVSNESDFTAVSFQTAEGTGWSRDWIPGNSIAPGQQFKMAFNVSPDSCMIPTRVTFVDGTSFEGDVNYCMTTMLTLLNDTIEAK